METRIFDIQSQYSILDEWARARGSTAIPKDIIPKLSLIVVDGDEYRAFTSLYMDNSIGVAMMLWTTTNPKNTPKQSKRALDYLLTAAKKALAEHGYFVLMTATGVRSISRFLRKDGFKILEKAEILITATKT